MDARNPDCLFLVLNGTDCSESFGSDCEILRSSRDSMYLGLINRDLPQGVARCSPTGSTKLGRQSIPLGTQMDIVHGHKLMNGPCGLDSVTPSDSPLESSNTSTASNLNQIKAALVIEDRGLGVFNNLSRTEVEVLQRLKVTKPNDRSEFMSVFIDKLLNITESFPAQIGIKLYLVVDGEYKDTVVLVQRLVVDNKLATVEHLLDKCGLEVGSSEEIMCQGICLDKATPVYFLRENLLQVDGFIHLVYRINSQ